MRLYVAGAMRPGGGNLRDQTGVATLVKRFKSEFGRKTRERQGCSLLQKQVKKKEEFPGFMGNMAPGNSFPQICVVSVSENALITK
jgi:hypothetical protein